MLLQCNTPEKQTNNTDSIQTANKIEIPDRVTYYEPATDNKNALVVAQPVTYDVIVKNPLPTDEWTAECLKNLKLDYLTNTIFQAIYKGKLKAYDFRSDTPLTIEEVKAIEKEYKRTNIGKIQFDEDWFFDENTMKLSKRVKSITFGYELRSAEDEVKGYKGGIKVFLGDSAAVK